jgi:DNA-binding response OmpR family regulator
MLILVVEDNAVLAFMIEDALIEAGHEVLGPVASAAEAITMANEFHPQLAIVDIDLGTATSGVEVARALSAGPRTPSLFSTGQIETARLNADAAIGALSKPYAPITVVDAVTAVAQRLAGQAVQHVPRELEFF